MEVAWIAMEFLAGKDLERFCKAGNLLPWSRVLEICARVADALEYAHKNGIVYRDVKPANIVLLESGEVKMTDFGIARVISSSQTKTGMVLGTPSYMSPEQIAGKKLDGRSDLFSLGVVLYELLTGERPFQGDSIASIMFPITSAPPPPVDKAQAQAATAPGTPRSTPQAKTGAAGGERTRQFATPPESAGK